MSDGELCAEKNPADGIGNRREPRKKKKIDASLFTLGLVGLIGLSTAQLVYF